jgi:hypothetical protein
MKIGIMQPYFFPYIGYFQLIDAVDTYVNLDHVSFMKRSYMTRNKIKNATLINVPVHKGSQNKKCTEIYVNFDTNHFDKMLKTIEYLYYKSPNYLEIKNLITPLFNKEKITISQFNLKIIKTVCKYLDINTKIIDSSEGYTNLKKAEGLQEITKKLKGKVYINAIGGKSLYFKDDFESQGILLKFPQMGKVEFDNPYASILDLMFLYPKEHIKKQLKKYTLI